MAEATANAKIPGVRCKVQLMLIMLPTQTIASPSDPCEERPDLFAPPSDPGEPPQERNRSLSDPCEDRPDLFAPPSDPGEPPQKRNQSRSDAIASQSDLFA